MGVILAGIAWTAGKLPLVIAGLAGLVTGILLLALAHTGWPLALRKGTIWAVLVVAVSGAAFVSEFLSLGFLLYGQLLALPAPFLGAYLLRKRMREQS